MALRMKYGMSNAAQTACTAIRAARSDRRSIHFRRLTVRRLRQERIDTSSLHERAEKSARFSYFLTVLDKYCTIVKAAIVGIAEITETTMAKEETKPSPRSEKTKDAFRDGSSASRAVPPGESQPGWDMSPSGSHVVHSSVKPFQ
jgi:hypothetical protein